MSDTTITPGATRHTSGQHRKIMVRYIDKAAVMSAARAKGWTDDRSDSIMDLVEPEDFAVEHECSSLTKAKAWACRNRARDFWNDPRIAVYECDNSLFRDFEVERVSYLTHIGDGAGWQEVY